MNETQPDLTVDKEMFSAIKETLDLQKREHIYRNGAWHRIKDSEKKRKLLNAVNKLIEMEELVIKRIDMYGKKCSSGLGIEETSNDRLIYILQKWKYFKEENGYMPVIVEYVLFEEYKERKNI